ncbi:ATP-binding protein [Bradyrhizobium sp. BRP22]|uniref:AAA family ATPase n=1 Tax=Bradyrhizobium sp. BRP22 TaxID=2793821 RepID=UPI001CD3BDE7|nr:AAA family ATPase [Bradyrhizobium sp. BRP22]MCA1458075.1 ATP-binding protein [Bradyrhizobium sp. BRP22]
MTFNLSIPRGNGIALDLAIKAGEVMLMLGANGTGKSSLMHRFYSTHIHIARRISAHRQTWFESNAITLSPFARNQTETNIRSVDSDPRARWMEYDSASRASMAIYDLVDAENVQARKIAGAAYGDDLARVKKLAKEDPPIKIVNELLRLSNIPVTITVQENSNIMASKNGSAPYSIAELSDGERNAILIAANVLTAKQGSLLLIDEPERHLHRSIISPLLTLLFAKRPDCAFVVSTHDLMLPLDNPSARTLLVRGCTYDGSTVTAWDADVLSPDLGIDDDLKRDILGARRRILFVEGDAERSLDKPLYSLVFPEVSVIAKASCRDVERAVFSIRDADGFHWLDAFGLVDNDSRAQSELDRLKGGGVYSTAAFSVEGVYYHPEIQRRVAERHAATTGDDFNKCFADATSAAITAITPHVKRLSERIAEKRVREEFFAHIPNKAQIAAAESVSISIDVPKIVEAERQRLQNALDAGDLTTVISRYPVRETPALKEIALKLGLQSRDQYEGAVRRLLMDDPNALIFVRSLFGTLAADIAADTTNAETHMTSTSGIVA